MKRLMIRTWLVAFLLCTKSHAQSGAVIARADAGHASQASCVILKRMGRLDRAKSRLPSLGISGKRFSYIEGKLPEGLSLHHKMTDHDVSDLQARGAQVLVLDSDYTSEDLQKARAGCQGEAGKTLNQREAKAPATPASGAIASTPTPSAMVLAPKAPTPEKPAPRTEDSAPSVGTMEAALLDVSSNPTEADVYVDERLSGRTPSTIILTPGEHNVVIKKDGFVVWRRRFKLPSGRTNVDAELVRKTK